MCGIAGVVSSSRRAAAQAVARMNAAQRHRGPDDSGAIVLPLPAGHLALGHRRLSIVDLSAAGHQPMHNPRTGDWIVYNGEIYNFLELRSQLRSHGARLQSNTDTEVILQAFAAWGERCVSRFQGMFAFALYDARNRRLILARDHLGIKPLYIARSPGVFAFSSEVRALLASGLVRDEVDVRGVAGLLAYGAVPAPLSMFKDVRMMEPGTIATMDLTESAPWAARLQPHRYWDFPTPQRPGQHSNLEEQLRSGIEESVRSHLISDVPLGIFLSSGIDSNAVAAIAYEQRGGDLDAFTVTLGEHHDFNEGRIAAGVARDLGIRFHEIALSGKEVRDQTHEFLDSLDQPTVDGLNTFIISRAVRQRGIVVALSGLGGDEVFAGYNSFRDVLRLTRWHRAARWIPVRLRRELAAWAFRRASDSRRYKAIELATKPRGLRNFCLRRRRVLSDFELESLGLTAVQLGLDEDYMPPEWDTDRALAGADAIASISVLESRCYMGNTLLRDADVFGMRHGLEIRVPLLDRRVVDRAYALPGSARARRAGVNKPALAKALGSRLHPDLLCLKKRGFYIPIPVWMNGPLREFVENSLAVVAQSGFFNPPAVHAVWESFVRYPDGPDWSRVWLLCVLGQYFTTHQQHIRAKAAA